MRDAINKVGIDAYTELDGMDRIRRVEAEKEKYTNEFEHHGLENFNVTYKKSTNN